MKRTEIINLAVYNIRKKKKTSVMTFLGIFFITLIVLSFILINISNGKANKNILNNFISVNYVGIYDIKLNDGTLNKVKEIKGVNEVVFQKTGFLVSGFIEVEFEGENYTNNTDFYYKSVENGNIFSINELKEFKNKYANQNIIIGGELQKINNEEIILSQSFIENCQIPTDVLNKKITIKYSYQDEDLKIKTVYLANEYIVRGLLNNNYNNLSANEGINTEIILNLLPTGSNDQNYKVYFDNFTNGFEGYKSLRTYFNTKSNIAYFGDLDAVNFLLNQQKIVNQIMLTIGMLILISSLVSVYSIIYFDYKKNKNYYKMLYMLGVPKKDAMSLQFWQLFIIFFVGLICAFFGTLIIINIIASLAFSFSSLAYGLNFFSYILVLFLTILFYLIISLIISKILLLQKVK